MLRLAIELLYQDGVDMTKSTESNVSMRRCSFRKSRIASSLSLKKTKEHKLAVHMAHVE